MGSLGLMVSLVRCKTVFVFNVPSIARVIWGRGHALVSSYGRSNLHSLVYKASGLSRSHKRPYRKRLIVNIFLPINFNIHFWAVIRLFFRVPTKSGFKLGPDIREK